MAHAKQLLDEARDRRGRRLPRRPVPQAAARARAAGLVEAAKACSWRPRPAPGSCRRQEWNRRPVGRADEPRRAAVRRAAAVQPHGRMPRSRRDRARPRAPCGRSRSARRSRRRSPTREAKTVVSTCAALVDDRAARVAVPDAAPEAVTVRSTGPFPYASSAATDTVLPIRPAWRRTRRRPDSRGWRRGRRGARRRRRAADAPGRRRGARRGRSSGRTRPRRPCSGDRSAPSPWCRPRRRRRAPP